MSVMAPTAVSRPSTDGGAARSSGIQDPGAHCAGQDPVPPPQIPSRPLFYLHTPPPPPPPPPLVHYQWPLPFYNPFAGFPGMGYGMVMPPFPQPSYMEAPAYIMPHPQLHPVDYRRLLQSHLHPPAVPYQNPVQVRRPRPSAPPPNPVRQTVNCEVQTEPPNGVPGRYREGSPVADSGQGTTPCSPSSSSSSSQKQEVADNYALVGSPRGRGYRTPAKNPPEPSHSPTAGVTLEARAERQDSGGAAPCRSSQFRVWSVSSPESIGPVCSSSRREDGAKERRRSVPDILMRTVRPQEPEPEQEGSISQGSSGSEADPAGSTDDDDDDEEEEEGMFGSQESLFKILKLPLVLHKLLSESRGEHEAMGQAGPLRSPFGKNDNLLSSLSDSMAQADTAETTFYQTSLSGGQMRALNESVWSVESLAPFVPPKDWLVRNGILEPQMILEVEEVDNAAPSRRNGNDHQQSQKFFLSDNWQVYSTPEKRLRQTDRPRIEAEVDAPAQQAPTPAEEGAGSGSSEAAAHESPNQGCGPEQRMESPPSTDPVRSSSSDSSETPPQTEVVSSASGEMVSSAVQVDGDWRGENGLQPSVSTEVLLEAPVSEKHFVDCGVQCSEEQRTRCRCQELQASVEQGGKLKGTDCSNGDGFGTNGHARRNQKKPWRIRRQEKNCVRQEAFSGHCSRSRSKGGEGRFSQCRVDPTQET